MKTGKNVRRAAGLALCLAAAALFSGCAKENRSEVSPGVSEVQLETVQKEPVEEKPVQEETAQGKPVEENPVQEETAQGKPVEENPVQEEKTQGKQAEENPVQEKPVDADSVQHEELLPEALPRQFTFSSGAGAWMTQLTLHRDGSFTGIYEDGDLGSGGEGYRSTIYLCEFSGRFDGIRKVDGHTWSMTLEELNFPDGYVEGAEWIEDEIRYVSAEPYGLEGGRSFLLYAPATPVKDLSEEFLSWMLPFRYSQKGDGLETLPCWGILNEELGYGFYAEEEEE